jgi:hypothetical protein
MSYATTSDSVNRTRYTTAGAIPGDPAVRDLSLQRHQLRLTDGVLIELASR